MEFSNTPRDRRASCCDAVLRLEGPVASVPHYRRAMEDPNAREFARNALCTSWMLAERRKEATECIDAMIAAYPDNPAGWRGAIMEEPRTCHRA